MKYVIAQATSRPLPASTARTLRLPLETRKAITLVGIRRSGKTYLLYQTMRRLLAEGVDRRQMLYLNFEDDRLLPVRTDELGYLAGEHEVNLVVNRLRPERLVNVAYSVAATQTWDREVAGLEWAGKRFPRANRTLVARERGRRHAPGDIEMVDAWRYLLEPAD